MDEVWYLMRLMRRCSLEKLRTTVSPSIGDNLMNQEIYFEIISIRENFI